MKRKPIVAGNWKMNKTVLEAVALVREIGAELGHGKGVDVVICPPITPQGRPADFRIFSIR